MFGVGNGSGLEILDGGYVRIWKIYKLFCKILFIKLDCRDRWRWALQKSGDFTVRELKKLVEEKILNVDSGVKRQFGTIGSQERLTYLYGGL